MVEKKTSVQMEETYDLKMQNIYFKELFTNIYRLSTTFT